MKGLEGLVGFGKKIVNGARNVAYATVASAALAGMGREAKADSINVYILSDDIAGSQMIIRHDSGSQDYSYDPGKDLKWANDPFKNDRPDQWMRLSSSPFNEPLYSDSRSMDSVTPYEIVIQGIGSSFSTDTAKIQFELVDGPDTQRTEYNYSLTSGSYHESGKVFDGMLVDLDSGFNTKYTGSFTYDSSVGATLTLTPVGVPEHSAFKQSLELGALLVGTWGVARCFGRGRRKEDGKQEYEVVTSD